MATKQIDGEAYKNMLIAAAAAIEERKEEINALNVFPVPDGDTGTNMSLTLSAAAQELQKLESPTLGRALEVTSGAMLRGARGNSGVITSLLFRGVMNGMKSSRTVDGAVLAAGLTEGANTAYKAVMKPAEGTILTVARVAGEAAQKAARKNREPEVVLGAAIAAAQKALALTTEQNPVLKKAGVVDAGAYGYVIILQGMQDALSGVVSRIARMIPIPTPRNAVPEGADFSAFDEEEINFAYCTEFIAKRQDPKRDPALLRAFLEGIGDCVVVVDDDEIIKIHVHTDTPDRALAEGLKYGMLSSIKIENMVEQHQRQVEDAKVKGMGKRESAAPERRYGFVSVAAGEGIAAVFGDLGADAVVEGGQTMNPSTEDILRAVDRTPAEVVFVLPNNKNIIMASQQAAGLSEKQVVVLPTKSVPQGICAMLSFDPDREPADNEREMVEAAGRVKSASVTYAARDSEFDGRDIKKGDYLGLAEGKLVATGPKFDAVMKKLAKELCDKDTAFITLLYGEGADEQQAAEVREIFIREAKNAEINILCGGQPVYSYIISVE